MLRDERPLHIKLHKLLWAMLRNIVSVIIQCKPTKRTLF